MGDAEDQAGALALLAETLGELELEQQELRALVADLLRALADAPPGAAVEIRVDARVELRGGRAAS